MASPDLNVILDEHHRVAEIQAKTTVRDASKAMKQAHSTASLIMEGGRIAGIFTTKVCRFGVFLHPPPSPIITSGGHLSKRPFLLIVFMAGHCGSSSCSEFGA